MAAHYFWVVESLVWVVGMGARLRKGLYFLWWNNLCVIIYALIVCRGSVCAQNPGVGRCVVDCTCVFAFVIQTREGCGLRGSFLLSQTLWRWAELQLWDPLISGTSGTQTQMLDLLTVFPSWELFIPLVWLEYFRQKKSNLVTNTSKIWLWKLICLRIESRGSNRQLNR